MRVLVAVLALCIGVALAASENEGYKVMSPGAHEVADCRALQLAISKAPASVMKTRFYRGYAHKFSSDILDCAKIASTGAIGAGVRGAAKQVVQAVDNFPTTVKKYWSTLKQKFTTQSAAQQSLAPFIPGPGEEENGLDDLWPALVIGAREPDLPCADRDGTVDNCLMGVAVGGAASAIAGLPMTNANKDAAAVDLKTKTIEVQKFSPQARASHFGHMSIAHAQTAYRPGDTSVPGVFEWLQNPKAIPDKIYNFLRRSSAKDGIKEPKQQDIADAIVDYCLHLYDNALNALNSIKPDKERRFTYHMARLGHTIMDSFSCSHCIRDADDPEHPIMFFTDYGSQSGELHAQNGDELPGKDFNAPTNAGYKFGIDRVAKAMQILIHAASGGSVPGAPYIPVHTQFVAPQGEKLVQAIGKAELKWYLETKVFTFGANKGFAEFSAKGCVTKDTVAPGKDAAICKLADVKKAGKKEAGKICPDRPAEWKDMFA